MPRPRRTTSATGWRVGLLAGVTVGLTALAHHVGGGELPSALWFVALVALWAVPSAAVMRCGAPPWLVAGFVGGSQVVGHYLFHVIAAAQPSGSASHHHGHHVVESPSLQVAHAGHHLTDPTMLGSHVAAGAVLGAMMAYADQLLDAARQLLSPPMVHVVDPVAWVPRRRCLPLAHLHTPLPCVRVEAHPTRGPPPHLK